MEEAEAGLAEEGEESLFEERRERNSVRRRGRESLLKGRRGIIQDFPDRDQLRRSLDQGAPIGH